MPARSARTKRQTRSEKLDLRLTARDKRILQEAAAVERRSVTEFVLHSALTRAEETLLDRRSFYVDAETYDRFMEALDAPARDIPRLKRLLTEPSVFDHSKRR
jgi:uncharacterized protein (DUF1778 family)